jgi:carbonic anhydrase
VGEIDELLANNRAFADSRAPARRDARPARALAILTCMDARIDVHALLGLRAGEAHVLRNAGGVVTDDVIRSLAISQRRLGTGEVMIIQHTDCGMQTITDDGFRSELERATGVTPQFPIESFTDLDESVRQAVRRVLGSPFLLDAARGFVYDVQTRRLREVAVGAEDVAARPAGARRPRARPRARRSRRLRRRRA